MKPVLFPILIAILLPIPAIAAGVNVDSLAGVYKHRFMDSTVDGHRYQAEDILELVRVTSNQVYMRMHLDFYNGHICSISGIANIEGGALVYRGKGEADGCILSIRVEGNKLTFHDEGGVCRDWSCGARGSYEGASFDVSARRDIRYMKRLLASKEYAAALAERDAKH